MEQNVTFFGEEGLKSFECLSQKNVHKKNDLKKHEYAMLCESSQNIIYNPSVIKYFTAIALILQQLAPDYFLDAFIE